MDQYLGEIRMFGGNFAPVGWALCQGQLMSISQYAALFSILGTTYGGDGISTFGLPDLQGRAPLHWGQGQGLSNYEIGAQVGVESVTLITNQMPAHTHAMSANSQPGTESKPNGAFLANSADASLNGLTIYSAATSDTTLNPTSMTSAGGSQPHDNMQPYLAINYIIATEGLFPTRN